MVLAIKEKSTRNQTEQKEKQKENKNKNISFIALFWNKRKRKHAKYVFQKLKKFYYKDAISYKSSLKSCD